MLKIEIINGSFGILAALGLYFLYVGTHRYPTLDAPEMVTTSLASSLRGTGIVYSRHGVALWCGSISCATLMANGHRGCRKSLRLRRGGDFLSQR